MASRHWLTFFHFLCLLAVNSSIYFDAPDGELSNLCHRALQVENWWILPPRMEWIGQGALFESVAIGSNSPSLGLVTCSSIRCHYIKPQEPRWASDKNKFCGQWCKAFTSCLKLNHSVKLSKFELVLEKARFMKMHKLEKIKCESFYKYSPRCFSPFLVSDIVVSNTTIRSTITGN